MPSVEVNGVAIDHWRLKINANGSHAVSANGELRACPAAGERSYAVLHYSRRLSYRIIASTQMTMIYTTSLRKNLHKSS
jgi:hypothetical protein